MNYLLELKDEDIFPDIPSYTVDDSWKNRTTVKVILLDDKNRVALVGVRYRLLPGGGVEGGETLEQAVIRECLEEVGCTVEVIKKIGVTKESRLQIKRIQETHCFVAHIVGEKGVPQSTQDDEQDMKVEWLGIEKALQLLNEQRETISPLSYHSQFNVRTHITFLEKFISEN